ncbi:protein SPMIP2 isoform X2 [Tamandua tetradactyla]|uniref:protein SPMIP2 isoform X2 n=1 Tax=Tamandua tetradactyla TaxID=48850 RepID=UPI004053B82C
MGSSEGPDYIKDHLPKIQPHTSYIGEKRPVSEKTGDLGYLWRPAPNRSFPAKYKHEHVGEIGWGIPEYNFINKTRLESGFHIKYGEISHAAIDQITHRYQSPWQPKPHILNMQGGCSRGAIAWHIGDYEDIHQRNSKWAVPVRQSKSPRASSPSKLQKLPQKKEGQKPLVEMVYDEMPLMQNKISSQPQHGIPRFQHKVNS